MAISTNERKAALTAAAFGNRLATSGSRTTTLELLRRRAVYFPRTSAGKSERRYSGRTSPAATRLGFFIAAIRKNRSPFFISAVDPAAAWPDTKNDHFPVAERDAVDRTIKSTMQIDTIISFRLG